MRNVTSIGFNKRSQTQVASSIVSASNPNEPDAQTYEQTRHVENNSYIDNHLMMAQKDK